MKRKRLEEQKLLVEHEHAEKLFSFRSEIELFKCCGSVESFAATLKESSTFYPQWIYIYIDGVVCRRHQHMKIYYHLMPFGSYQPVCHGVY